MEPTGQSWICDDTETHLCDFLDGTLAAEIRSQLEFHAASCEQCASILASVDGLAQRLQKLLPVEEPPQLVSTILDATLGSRRKSPWTAWFDWLQPVTRPGVVYGAVSLLVTAIVISQALGIQWRSIEISDLKPVTLIHVADRRAHQAYARGVKVVSDLRLVYEIQTRLNPDEDFAQREEAPVAAPGGAVDDGPRQPRKFRASERLSNISVHDSPGSMSAPPLVLARSGRSF